MSRPLSLQDLDCVYSEMNKKWINSPEKWSIDPKLSPEDIRTCLAIYSLDKIKVVSYTWRRLMNWIKPLLEYGILYTNYPSSNEGLLHFTFHQLSKFNDKDKDNNLNEKNNKILFNYLKNLSGLHIIFRGLLITPTGIALKGYPSDEIQLKKLMTTRNNLKAILELAGIEYDPPYINDICHSTLFRWTKNPTEEIINYIQKGLESWNETVIGNLHPKSWSIGAGTYIMQEPNRKEFASFYCPTFIAHRGLINGPSKQKENKLNILKEHCGIGIYTECDIWYINDKLFLGHDNPEIEIQFEDINSPYLFLHAKNKKAYEFLLTKANYEGCLLNIFWHTTEDYVVTNLGDIIVYPGKELIEDSIFMMPENSEGMENKSRCKYICSDYSL